MTLPVQLMKNPVLDEIYEKYGTYLLPQAWPEGSEVNPSYMQTKGALISAQVTILKAWYNGDFMFPKTYEASKDGVFLNELTVKVTVNDELDKFASNCAFLCNASGVHYRSDAKSLKLGETIAINVLQEYTRRNQNSVKFTIKKRNGSLVMI